MEALGAVSAAGAPSSSSSRMLQPLEHALLGWSTLWQFPPPAAAPRSLALSVTKELAAVLALLHSAAAAHPPAAAAALPRLLQLAEKGPFKKDASFDQAVGDLWLPSVAEFEERMKLKEEAETLKLTIKNSRANADLHKPLINKLKAELACLEEELKAMHEKEETLERELPLATSSSAA
ncbi:hypothetical protein Efla_001076 [Eimeria flavescens]